MKMQKILLIFFCSCYISVSAVSAAANVLSSEFEISFFKGGETAVNFCPVVNEELDTNNALSKIEFPLWRLGDVVAPSEEFGIWWKIYSGFSYNITLSFNARFDWSSQYMLEPADGSEGLNFNTEVDLLSNSGTVIGNISSGDRDIEIISGIRAPYSEVSGQAKVKITLEEQKDQDGNLYYLGGYYRGYARVTLTSV